MPATERNGESHLAIRFRRRAPSAAREWGKNRWAPEVGMAKGETARRRKSLKLDHIEMLVCPRSGEQLVLGPDAVVEGDRVREGHLVEPRTGERYPIKNYIPRFVPQENYAKSFGVEWAVHCRTQYDEYSGVSLSQKRFEEEAKWEKDLGEQRVLEVGSGSGRFTREALKTGALLVSFDYSNAVEANYAQNGASDRLLLVQASVYEAPFRREYFNKAFCFGVLQHTPDPKAAFMKMVQQVRPGGRVASDVYLKNIAKWLLGTKYWVRPFTRNRDPERLYARLKKYVDVMWPLAKVVRRIPRIGPALNWRLLIADYSRDLPDASDEQLREWAHLDTFDMLSPQYDKPQTLREFRAWHHEAGLKDIEVVHGYNGVEGRGTKVA